MKVLEGEGGEGGGFVGSNLCVGTEGVCMLGVNKWMGGWIGVFCVFQTFVCLERVGRSLCVSVFLQNCIVV